MEREKEKLTKELTDSKEKVLALEQFMAMLQKKY